MASLVLAGGVFTLRSSLTPWAANAAKGTPLEVAFYRAMPLPGGVIVGRRAPAESRDQLSALIQRSPQQSDLYALRAQENERIAEPVPAEADWLRAAETATPDNRAAAYLDVAHFYERRVEPGKAFEALLHAAVQPSPTSERFSAPEGTVSYRAYDEALGLTRTAALPQDAPSRVYESWIQRWPDDTSLHTRYFEALVAAARQQAMRPVAGIAVASLLPKAQGVYDRYVAAHPEDTEFAVAGRAELAELGGKDEFTVYDQLFTPLWPDSLADRYYQLLSDRHQLRKFVADARAQAVAQPAAVGPALRLYFYYSRQGKKERAEVALLEFEARHEAAHAPWTAEDLKTLGILFERLADPDEAAKAWYSLYSLPNAGAMHTEGLARLARLLLLAPEQHVRFGNRDLSLYSNVAQMDRHPGFLNGILSVLFTASDPLQQYASENETASAYFHRAAASDLIERLKKEAPNAPQLVELEQQLFAAYALYGQDDAIISRAPDYLNKYGNAPQFIDVALLLGDAYAHKKNRQAEFALYDRLLAETAAKSDHVPVGVNEGAAAPQNGDPGNAVPNDDSNANGNGPGKRLRLDQRNKAEAVTTGGPRSPAYTRVLDRYLSRLTETSRLKDALALYRREIDHNPDDPGLYERLATFIEQNKFDGQLEPLYRDAMKKFSDPTWSDKLARLYLREKRYQDYQALTKQLIGVFSGSELERYLAAVPPNNGMNDSLYVSVNEAAHDKFPHNLTFVRNLLGAYNNVHSKAYSATKYEALLRQNWFYAPDLRTNFLGLLTSRGRLETELVALPKTAEAEASNNTLALQFAAEGNGWLTRYEAAAPSFAVLDKMAPGDNTEADRAISVHRSLADSVPGAFETAVHEADMAVYASPHDHAALTRVGEIYADREQYAKAAPYWDKLASTGPRSPEGYLEAATVFWDYYQFDNAQRLLELGRSALNSPLRYSYESGAIFENKEDMAHAVDEYIQAAIETPTTGANGEAQRRLMTLGRRKATHSLVEEKTVAAARQGSPRAVDLRIALLENQGRPAEIHQLLHAEVTRATSTERLAELRSAAARFHFNDTSERALERVVALTNDPVEKLEAQLDLANFRESRKDLTGAQEELNGVLRENPEILGVIRANVNFYNRTKQLTQAVTVLENAAASAVAPYKKDLLKEAASTATEGRDYAEARKILDRLLADDPYDGDLLAAKANTYAQQGDSEALAAFYRQTLDSMNQAPLPPLDKQARVAGLRRGYILALTKLERYQEGLDQYIEILNRYPEDELLTTEAAHYAESHNLADRLTGYYEKTAAASPKDYRWPLALGRVDRALRKYPEAISSFEVASKIRPDRLDLLTDKVDLETRLLRFDDAIKTNQRLYELSYHSSTYLAAQAELYARLGRRQETIQLLRKAYIDGRPKEYVHYAMVAYSLHRWGFLEDARKTYEEVLPLILGAETANQASYGNYLQLLTILREHNLALKKAFAADKTKKQPFAQQWADEIGATIGRYYTPEEKALFAKEFATPGRLPATADSLALLRTAGLNDVLSQRLAARASAKPLDGSLRSALITLESSQLRYATLGQQLENIAKSLHGRLEYAAPLDEAAAAYRKAGDDASELRVYDVAGDLGTPERYARLIANAPATYATRIPTTDRGRMIVTELIATTDEKRAFMALDALRQTEPPLWHPAYDALTGVYWSSTQVRVTVGFTRLLGPRTVAEQLSQKATWRSHLTGDPWSYYGSRYGGYELAFKKPDAGDYLPAGVEWSAAASSRYLELGDTYLEAGHNDEARTEYEAALELSPQRAEIVDRLARLDWGAGRKAEAIEKWRQAFDLERTRVLNTKLTPSFWATLRNMLIEANRNRIVEQIKPNANSMFASYVRFNGGYNFTPFIEGILTDAPDRAAALQWIEELTADEKASSVLEDLVNSPLLTVNDRDAVYRELIARDQHAKPPQNGEDDFRSGSLRQHQIQYVRFLDDHARYEDAWRLVATFKAQDSQFYGGVDLALVIHIAAHSGHLDTLLGELKKQQGAGEQATMLAAGGRLKEEGQTAAANKLLEFVYTAQLSEPYAPASAYFGLAELRLSQKRNDEALALLRDVTLSVGTPFENLEQAGLTLEKAGLKTEARDYYQQWQKAIPWDPRASISRARLNGSAADLDKTRQMANVEYSIRVDAAEAMRALHALAGGKAELDLLTQAQVAAAQAEIPYGALARLLAARQAKDPATQMKLLLEAIAIRPDLIDPRADLARSALAMKRDRLAVSAFESQGGAAMPTYGARRFEHSEPLTAKYSETDRSLRAGIAAAYRRLGQPSEARATYVSLLAMDPPEAQEKSARTAIAEIDQSLRLEAANRRRAPTVLGTIDQGAPVRARLKAPPPLDADDDQAGALNQGGPAQ